MPFGRFAPLIVVGRNGAAFVAIGLFFQFYGDQAVKADQLVAGQHRALLDAADQAADVHAGEVRTLNR